MSQPSAPPPLATSTELATRLGRELDVAKTARTDAILADISAYARGEAGQTWSDLAAVPADVKAVVLAAAMRVFVNPNMYVSRNAGTFAHRIHDSAFATGVFTADEKARLAKARANARGRSGLWTQETYRGDVGGCDDGFVPVVGFADPFPVFGEDDPFNRYGDHYGDR